MLATDTKQAPDSSGEASGRRPKPSFSPILRVGVERFSVFEGKKPKDIELPAMQLRFDYGGGQLAAPQGDETDDDFDFGEETVASFPRDHGAEARAQCTLEAFGVLDLTCVEDLVPSYDSTADYVLPSAEVHQVCSFMAHAVPQLRQLGWQVDVDDDFPFTVYNTDVPWYANVEPDDEDEREDWFSLELGVDIGGERINLLPALLELLEQSPDESSLENLLRVNARYRALSIGDDRYVTLPPDRLKRLLRVLMDLYRDAARRQDERDMMCFKPDAAAAGLCEIDDVLGTSQRGVRWEGSSDVLERARALVEGPAHCAHPVSLKATLRPYQEEGLTWMQHLRAHSAGGVLADDMGLGKTLQTIANLTKEKEGKRTDLPSLVLLPTSLIGNWQRELKKFAPHLRVLVLHGPKRHKRFDQLPKAEVVLTTYPLLVRDLELFTDHDFHYVILDEAQAIKNPRSRVSRAVRELTSRHRLCLTGTPVENNLEELWSLFDFLNPGLLGDAARFRTAYRQPIEQRGDEDRLVALRKRVGPFIIRRLKEEVATELPPKTELVRPVELQEDQRELYESIRVAAHSQVRHAIRKKGLAASTVAILDALMRLRQVCCDPRLVRGDAARQVERSAKLELFKELMQQQLGQGRRVLVFSQFTRMLGLISQELASQDIGHVVLTGGTQNRQALVDRFERDREVDVFLISLKAGGTGLNLVSADTVIHYDPWWNAAAQAQATDRAYRIGQTRPVFVYNLIVSGSVEERILRLQQRKRHLANVILGAQAEASGLTEADIDDLLAPLDES